MFNKNTKSTIKDRNFFESEIAEKKIQTMLSRNSVNHVNNSSISSIANMDIIGYESQDVFDSMSTIVNNTRIDTSKNSTNYDEESDKNSLHKSIIPILILSKIIGLFPIQGIRGKNSSYLVFKWFSWTTLYTAIMILISLSLVTFTLHKNVFKEWQGIKDVFNTQKKVDDLVTSTTLVINYILFIPLAQNWPTFMTKWELMEQAMSQFGYPPNFAFKIKVMASIVMIYTVGIIILCHSDFDYIVVDDSQTMSNIDYIKVLLYTGAIWTPSIIRDMFIITIAYSLFENFKQLNQKLVNLKKKVDLSNYWFQLRNAYDHLSKITRELDQIISPLLLLSLVENLIYICFDIIHFKNSTFYSQMYVLIFNLGITSAIISYTSSISIASKLPKYTLYSVPSEYYGLEVSRFLIQVTSNNIALTGWKLFSIESNFLLTFYGCTITYLMYRLDDHKNYKNCNENNMSISPA